MPAEAPAPFRLDARRLARLAWAHRLDLLRVNAVVAVVAVAVVLLLPCWYTSSVTLVPAPGDAATPDFTGAAAMMASRSLSLDAGPTPQDQLKMVVTSRAVADSVIRRLDLATQWRVKGLDRTRERLADHTNITTPKQGQLIVEAEAQSPKLARDMAVAYTDFAASEGRRLKQSLATQRRIYLDARLAELEREITTASAAVERFEQVHKMVALSDQTRETMDAAGLIQTQAALVQTELVAARRFFTEQSPEVAVLRDRLGELNRQMRELTSHGGTLLLKSDDLPALKQDYLKLTREQQSLMAVSELLRRVYEQARVEEANPVPMFSVLDAAEVPELRSSPRRGLTVAIALALSLSASLGILYVHGSLEPLTRVLRRRTRPALSVTPGDGANPDRREAA
jgi:tyrosine-protein kinase Etk/Wzc